MAEAWLGFVVVSITLSYLLGRLILIAKQLMVLRSLNSKYLLDVVEEIRQLVVVVLPEK